MLLNDSLHLYKRCIIHAIITVSVECMVFFLSIKVQIIENTCTDFDS